MLAYNDDFSVQFRHPVSLIKVKAMLIYGYKENCLQVGIRDFAGLAN